MSKYFLSSQFIKNDITCNLFILLNCRNSGRAGTIHDIALIRVNGTILFGDKVTPINLPSCDFDVKKDGES